MAQLRLTAMIFVAALFVGACAGETPDSGGDAGSAADTSAEPAAPAAPEYDLDTLIAAADPNRGRRLFLQCRACHSVEEGGDHKVGPNLWDMFGTAAAAKTGFAYSDALTNSGIVWTASDLDQWMARPSQFVPGNQMVFVGIRKPEDRAALIAYLVDVTTPSPAETPPPSE